VALLARIVTARITNTNTKPKDAAGKLRRCQRTSRSIAKLRGHGLVAKIPRTRRYRVTRYGQRMMSAAIALHDREFPGAYAAAA
jgi:predicted transcriptional regulator